jgi:signal transduction histidine kinase
MLDPRTLQGRFTYAYTVALAVALLVFAIVSLVIFDRFQERQLDRELQAAATALAADSVHEGRFGKHEIDRDQAMRITGPMLSGAVLADDGSTLFETAPIPPLVRRAALDFSRSVALQTIGSASTQMRVALAPVLLAGSTAGVSVAWHALDEDEDLDNRILLSFAVAIPIVTILAILCGALIARRGLEPIQRIATLASEIEAKNLSRRLNLGSPKDELGQLAAAFDRMLDRLEDAFRRERRFTSDASHELRAPLSVIRATADYALSKQRDSAAYRRALQTIALESEELDGVVCDLLADARAEARPSPNDARADVADVAAVAFDVAEQLFPLARSRNITIRRTLPDEASAAIEASELGRALRAILDNAIAYAREGGCIELTVSTDGAAVTVIVLDDGPGFSQEALRHATERFWRDDLARQRDEGSGLGLAIARGIVESAGGTVLLGNAAQGGAEVIVRLAAASPT